MALSNNNGTKKNGEKGKMTNKQTKKRKRAIDTYVVLFSLLLFKTLRKTKCSFSAFQSFQYSVSLIYL
jgi:hypothetical protein